VPKFQLDYKNKSLNYLNKTKYPKYNISLLDKEDKEIFKFEVDLSRLSFLNKELGNVSIYHYPIIIFEFIKGYFTTEELFKKNIEFGNDVSKEKDVEIVEKKPKNKKKKSPDVKKSVNFDIKETKTFLSSEDLASILDDKKDTQKDKEKENTDSKAIKNKTEENKKSVDNLAQSHDDDRIKSVSTFVISNNSSKKDISKSTISTTVKLKKSKSSKKIDFKPEKKEPPAPQIIKFSEYYKNSVMLDYLINPQNEEKTSLNSYKEVLTSFSLKDIIDKYERKSKIKKLEEEINILERKNKALEELNKNLEKTIKTKNENLEKLSAKLESNKDDYKKKVDLLKAQIKERGKNQLIYDSFVYQKMTEICFFFFNNKLQSLYNIPNFYNEPMNESTKAIRLKYYNDDKKKISAMMGYICQLMIYISKTFNIPMRYPIFLNGSKSYILKGIKDKNFLPLYFDAKKEDKNGNFENALNCLKKNIIEVFNFLSLFPEIMSKADYENINELEDNYLFFFYIVVFNHSLYKFMKSIQNSI
jgi:hypothetical protein